MTTVPSLLAEVGILDRNLYALFCNDTVILIALIHNLILTIYHIIKLICFNKKSSKPTTIQYLSICTMILLVHFNFSVAILTFDIHPIFKSHCKWIVTYVYISYMAIKGALFYLFSERLFQVFEKSTLKFSQCQIWSSRLIIFLYIAGSMAIVTLIGDGIYDDFMAQCITNDPIYIQGTYSFYLHYCCSTQNHS